MRNASLVLAVLLLALPSASAQRRLRAHPKDRVPAPDTGPSLAAQHARPGGRSVTTGAPTGSPVAPASKPAGAAAQEPTGRQTGFLPAPPRKARLALAGPGYHARFDASGTARIEVSGVPLSYRLRGLSAAGRRLPLAAGRPAQAGSGRVEIARGHGVTESWQQAPEGVELAFTLERPLGGDLTLTGDLDTGLLPDRTTSRTGFVLGGLVKIGATKVIDAAGREYLARVELRDRRMAIHVPGAWLAAASYPVVVDPLIGSNIQVSSASVDETRPECAYDKNLDRFLVVYEYKFAANDLDVYGRFVDKDGNPVGAPFVIRNGNKNEARPVVAFSPTSNRYYVAIEYNNKDIIATILDQNGTIVVGAYFVNNLVPGTKAQMPSAVWNGTDNHFGVSWSDDRDGDDDLFMQVDLPTGALQIDDTELRDSVTTDLINSRLVHYAPQNWYWVIYESTVCNNLAFAFDAGLVAMQTPVVTVFGQTGADKVPHMALSGNVLMAVNEHLNGSFNRVLGQLIDAATGDLVGANFVVHEPVSLDAEDPHIAASPQMNAFVVVWHATTPDGDTDILAAEYNDAGEALSGVYTVTQSPNPNANEFYPAVCANTSSNSFLAFWQDGRNGADWNIFTQKIAVNPFHVQEPPGDPVFVAHRVLAHSGEFFFQRTLMSIPGRLPAGQLANLYGGSPVDFDFTVAYRSGGRGGADPDPTPLGYNWYHTYLESILPGSGEVDLLRGDGRRDTFTWNGSFYQAPDGFYEKITLSGGVYTLTDRHGLVKQYSNIGGVHKLSAITFRNNTISLAYGANNEISTLTDTRGKQISFAYTGSRLDSFTDFFNRSWVFGYHPTTGDLITMRSPTTTEYPAGKTTTFAYDSGQPHPWRDHDLQSITDPKGQQWLVNTYSIAGRVTAQQCGAATQNFQLSYSGNVTTETNRRNHRRDHFFDPGPWTRNKLVIYTAGLRPGDPPSYTIQFTHNVHTELDSAVYPRGNSEQWTFDHLNPDPLAQGNLLSARRISHLAGQPDLVASWTYENQFNQPKTYTNARGFTQTNIYDFEEPTLGDQNGDGITNQTLGNLIVVCMPTVTICRQTAQVIKHKFWHNATSQIIRVIQPGGRNDVILYFGPADPAKDYVQQVIVDSGGLALTTTYARDQVGNVTAITTPRGFTWAFLVNQLDQTIQSTAPAPFSYVIKYIIDPNDNIEQVQVQNVDDTGTLDPVHPWINTVYGFDVLDYCISVTQDVSATKTVTTQQAYDAEQSPTITTLPLGNKVECAWDERYLLLTCTLAPGTADAVTDSYAWDGNGNLFTITDCDNHVTTCGNDGYDRPDKITDAKGDFTEISYTEEDDVSGQTRKTSAGAILSQVTFTRDEVDRICLIAYLFKDSAGNPVGDGLAQVEISYTADSLVDSVTDDNAHQQRFGYDTGLRCQSIEDHLGVAGGTRVEYVLDADGNPLQILSKQKNNDTGALVTYRADQTIDQIGRVSSRTIDPLGLNLTSTCGYNSRDIRTRHTDAEGKVWRLTVDGRNLPTQEVHDAGGLDITTTIVWTDNSTIQSRTDPNGNLTTWGYDFRDWIKTVTYADSTVFTVDARHCSTGEIAQYTDQNGTQVTYTRDAVHLVTQINVIKGAGVIGHDKEVFAHDALYRPTLAETWNGANLVARTQMSYNTLSQQDREDQSVEGGAAKSVTCAWDGAGNRTGLTYPGGRAFTLGRDDVNRLSSITEGANIIASYKYEGWKTARRDYLNGTTLTQLFDGAQRTTQMDHKQGAAVLAGFQYAYNKEHRKKYENRTHLGKGDAYGNDGVYRLTGSKFGVPSADFSPTKNYSDYLTFTKEKTYTLDATANRKETNDGGAVTQYNQVGGSYSPDSMNEYFNVAGVTQLHDNTGNLTDDGQFTFKFNYRNQLVEIVRKSDSQTMSTNLYDAKNRRVKRTDEAGVVTYFCWDGWRVIEERDAAGAVLATYVHGNVIDELLTMTRGGATYYYHANHMGSISHVTDGAGNIVERYEFTPYGIPTIYTGPGADGLWNTADDVTASNSAIGNPYLFQGRRWEGATLGSVYHWRNRWYDAERGRWIQRDPKGLYGDAANRGNAYGAFGGNPLDSIDPLGEKIEVKGVPADVAAFKKELQATKDRLEAIEKNTGQTPAMLADLRRMEKDETVFEIRLSREKQGTGFWGLLGGGGDVPPWGSEALARFLADFASRYRSGKVAKNTALAGALGAKDGRIIITIYQFGGKRRKPAVADTLIHEYLHFLLLSDIFDDGGSFGWLRIWEWVRTMGLEDLVDYLTWLRRFEGGPILTDAEKAMLLARGHPKLAEVLERLGKKDKLDPADKKELRDAINEAGRAERGGK